MLEQITLIKLTIIKLTIMHSEDSAFKFKKNHLDFVECWIRWYQYAQKVIHVESRSSWNKLHLKET